MRSIALLGFLLLINGELLIRKECPTLDGLKHSPSRSQEGKVRVKGSALAGEDAGWPEIKLPSFL